MHLYSVVKMGCQTLAEMTHQFTLVSCFAHGLSESLASFCFLCFLGTEEPGTFLMH